ncbi:hypothetical protein ACHAXT_004191 [Thalassiosira profunda]
MHQPPKRTMYADNARPSGNAYSARIRQMVVDATANSAHGNFDGDAHDDTPAPTPTASNDQVTAGYDAGAESPASDAGQLVMDSSLESDRIMAFDEENARFSFDADRSKGRWVGTPERYDRYSPREGPTADEAAVRDFKARVSSRAGAAGRKPRFDGNGSNEAAVASPADAPADDHSHSTGDFFLARPHLAKRLFFFSVALVVVSLGLAAAGLGMMYQSSQVEEPREQQPEGVEEGLEDFTVVDLGDVLPTIDTLPVDDADDGPKAQVPVGTAAPTGAPSVDALDPDGEFDFLGGTFDEVDEIEIDFLEGDDTPGPTASPSTDDLTDAFNFGDILSHTIHPVADTWLEFNDTEAYGNKKRLKVDGDATRVTLLKFNVSELPANVTDLDIVSVALRLYALTDSPFGGKVEQLGNHCSGWDEYNVSWTNAAKCVMRDNAQLLGQFDAVQEYSWNEAEIALDLAEEDLPELITLRVTSHFANGVTYASRENATAAPELVVYYVENEVAAIEAPAPTVSPEPTTSPAPSASPTATGAPSAPTVPPTKGPTTGPTKSPSYAPSLPFPSYMPTVSPTWNGTQPPTESPSTTPEDLVIVASQDATIRGGDFDDDPLGEDPFLTLRGPLRKSILEFDLSSLRPSFDYAFTLKIFIAFVSFNEQRSVTASYVSEEGWAGFDEETVTWNNFGAPNTTEIGWFSIFQSDEDTSVDIPLGSLPTSSDTLTIILEIQEDADADPDAAPGGPGDKFDFRSREFAEWAEQPEAADTAPTLLAEPELDE